MLVNGKEMQLAEGITVEEMLEELSIKLDRVVVEVDFDIIPREEYGTRKLDSSSKVEVISFVGGG